MTNIDILARISWFEFFEFGPETSRYHKGSPKGILSIYHYRLIFGFQVWLLMTANMEPFDDRLNGATLGSA